MIKESSSQRSRRIHKIAKDLLSRFEHLEKLKAYFVLIGKEWNEEKILFEIANKYSSLEARALENGYGIYNERWNNGWQIVLEYFNNDPGEEMIPELFYHIGISSLSLKVTDEMKG
jgi:hypothetical protein